MWSERKGANDRSGGDVEGDAGDKPRWSISDLPDTLGGADPPTGWKWTGDTPVGGSVRRAAGAVVRAPHNPPVPEDFAAIAAAAVAAAADDDTALSFLGVSQL